jgi:hypothetical protein
MTTPSSQEMTCMLAAWRNGDQEAIERLTPLIYGELRFFGGLTNEEAGEVMGMSLRTVNREWWKAKAWLRRAIING